MGDLSDGHACNAVILAFTDDLIKKYRSEVLDRTFGDKIRYYVMADDYCMVRLYAVINVDEYRTEEHFRVEKSPELCGPSDGIIDELVAAFPELSRETVEKRLAEGAELNIAEIKKELEAETVECKFCNKQVPANTAHLHQGAYVGAECGCWDERLRSTE